jgi:hypothetical protein
VRKEYTCNHEQYHGEFLHAMAIAVNTIPDRCLSFQVVFTGCESDFDDNEQNVHGGAMWARMPITALVADEPLEEWPERMETHLAQPWDCSSHHHSIVNMERVSSSPWICKIDGEFYGNIVALPNNRVRATSPALWETGEGPPDFKPSQFLHAAEIHTSYLDPETTFNNLYAKDE